MATLYERAFRRLGITEDDCFTDIAPGKLLDRYEVRKSCVGKYGFAIPTSKILARIKALGPVLEVGAGTGYWAYELRKAKADVVATDIRPNPRENGYCFQKQWSPVECVGAEEAVEKYGKGRVLLMVWPCYDRSWAYKALKSYRKVGGTTLVYVGERMGGCTANDAFFLELEEHWNLDAASSGGLPSWPMIYDDLSVYRRP